MEHLVASHKHGLSAASRKKLCLLWGEEYGEKYPAFNSNIYYIKMEKKSDKQNGEKMEEKWGKKSREKIKKKIWKKI